MKLGITTESGLGGCAGDTYLVPAGTKVAKATEGRNNWYVLEESDVRDCGVNDHDAAHYHLWIDAAFVQEIEA